MPEAHRGQSVRTASIAPCFRGSVTYTDIHGADYQILVEADFLVNLYEDQMGKNSAESVLDKIFRTGIGRKICEEMFALHESGRMLESDTAVSITGLCSLR